MQRESSAPAEARTSATKKKRRRELPKPLTYTVEQAAALVGVSPDSYYRELNEGERSGDPKVPGMKFRGRWVIPRAHLHRFLGVDEVPPLHEVDDIPTEWGGSPRRAMDDNPRDRLRARGWSA